MNHRHPFDDSNQSSGDRSPEEESCVPWIHLKGPNGIQGFVTSFFDNPEFSFDEDSFSMDGWRCEFERALLFKKEFEWLTQQMTKLPSRMATTTALTIGEIYTNFWDAQEECLEDPSLSEEFQSIENLDHGCDWQEKFCPTTWPKLIAPNGLTVHTNDHFKNPETVYVKGCGIYFDGWFLPLTLKQNFPWLSMQVVQLRETWGLDRVHGLIDAAEIDYKKYYPKDSASKRPSS